MNCIDFGDTIFFFHNKRILIFKLNFTGFFIILVIVTGTSNY